MDPRASDAQWYEEAAGLLRRVVPIAPPFPDARTRKPLRSEAAADYIDADPITGGIPPDDDPTDPDTTPGGPFDPANPIDIPDDDGPDTDPGGPFDPTDPHDFPPDDPDDPYDPSGPTKPGSLHVVVQQAQYPGDGDDSAAQAVIARPDQATFTDTFDTNGPAVAGPPGPWWTPLKGTWQTTAAGILHITAIGAANNPRAALLYNPVDYTLGQINLTLDNVTAGSVRYAIARGADDGAGQLNGYVFRAIGPGTLGSCALGRMTGGAFTLLGATFSQAMAAGDTMGIRANGSTIEALYNGAVIASRADATYASGKLGIGGDSTVPAFRTAALSPT